MNRNLLPIVLPVFAAFGGAQNPGYLFTTSQTETTLSGSGGTVLQTLRRNEVSEVEFIPCPVISAEKWAPLGCFQTMAGDDNNDSYYSNPTMFGAIDALCDMPSPVACSTARTVYFSPSVTLGTNISGSPGLRPGDTGRIVRNSSGDGQVEYFLRAEDLQISLGMPPTPVVVDVDAIAADPGYGIFFSLDQNHAINTTCGNTTLLDGDVWVIPPWAITWTFDMRVQSVVPGCAQQLYSEAQMDAMVVNAGITDRFGNCITQIVDCEALDIDYTHPATAAFACPGTVIQAPVLIFSGETMTGCGLCTTDAGGQIWTAGCGRMGSACGTSLPTLGNQIGLLPPSASLGVPSYVNALAGSWINRFVVEPQQPLVFAPTTISIDVYTPAFPTVLFAKLQPPTVPPSFPLPNCFFPDAYILPWDWSSGWTGPGFVTVTTPLVTLSGVKAVFQAATIISSQIVLSTPATVDIN
jgi:hypothetical protein